MGGNAGGAWTGKDVYTSSPDHRLSGEPVGLDCLGGGGKAVAAAAARTKEGCTEVAPRCCSRPRSMERSGDCGVRPRRGAVRWVVGCEAAPVRGVHMTHFRSPWPC